MHGKPSHIGRPLPWLNRMDEGSAAGWAGVVAGAVYLWAQMLLVVVVRHDSPWVPLQRISAGFSQDTVRAAFDDYDSFVAKPLYPEVVVPVVAYFARYGRPSSKSF